ncbi:MULTISPECIES: YeeE/YedE family protein [Pacificibacter]|uniref:YeeE/YedE family protein n=1 Tax=Pacificibacter TaxID=1042323 RepID=UPI001C08B432|nr:MULTISPECIES: YeeE/YedE thiosulfate transporter family protein [Pacificibacter]MBU2936291.1 YeeE/YedE family protein [Pacificibacter marinus]MDO6616761.1 YeeE/YedE thiosulfate transporter family protein [Pacificibacter sp. 1_MG-2023]
MITEFTPWASLIGGILIGGSAVLLMAFQGRVFGATGILAGFLQPNGSGDWAWRAAILAGMVTGPTLYMLFTGAMPAVDVPVSRLALIVGGFIVGLGVTFGSGCTSGHGVCGMARLSPRSIAATVTFMITTGFTVYIVRHILGGV